MIDKLRSDISLSPTFSFIGQYHLCLSNANIPTSANMSEVNHSLLWLQILKSYMKQETYNNKLVFTLSVLLHSSINIQTVFIL